MIIAVDTGATKTFVQAFTRGKKESQRHRFATPKDSAQYVEILANLLAKQYDLKKATAISIAAPGLVENQQITFCTNLPWQNFDLISALKEKLSLKMPMFLQNDANLAGLAEIHVLSVIPEVGLYITVSTGIGSGVIINGQIDPILQRSHGGRIILEFDGIMRDWEGFASGSAIYETYGKYAHDIDAIQVWEAIADKISRGLIVLIPLFIPDVIIIGGSIGTYYPRYHAVLEKLIKERVPPGFRLPQLLQAVHPQEAVLYGCEIHARQRITK